VFELANVVVSLVKPCSSLLVAVKAELLVFDKVVEETGEDLTVFGVLIHEFCHFLTHRIFPSIKKDYREKCGIRIVEIVFFIENYVGVSRVFIP
jgi:hypothetical protein